MATYIDIHSGYMDATEDELRAAHLSRLSIEADEGVHFERAWLDAECRKVFCLSTAPSKEAVLRIHERSGQPAVEVYDVSVEWQS